MTNKSPLVILSILFLCIVNLHAQTTVNSLEELVPYLKLSNANVKVAPGTYTITAADINDGTFGFLVPAELPSYAQNAVFLFEGNDSTYDFTGVTINFKTEVLSSFGNTDAREIQIIGNNNVLLNLTMVDDGSVDDAPGRRATNIVIDGRENRVEGFHVSIKGSYPYGYGDIFGKGGGSTIAHNKHSACLVRGDSNHVKDCTFIHKAYGHCIFFQAANDPFIEGCYLEGELRTVGEVIAEEGTGSPADNINFLTTWGYDLRDLEHDYTFSLQEDGIRAYNGGTTIIDGIEYGRTVTNARVIDNTIVKMRSGVTLGLGRGTQYVENCTALACESGFWVRDSNATIVNCRGDASVGPLYSEDAERSGVTAELTLLHNYIDKVGNTPSLYIAGSNHNFTLHDGTTTYNDEIEILISGQRNAHRFLEGSGEEPPNRDATSITFNNNTKYPIILGSNASSNNVTSCGIITDNGSGNNKAISTTCNYERPCINNAGNLQAECYDTMSGVTIQDIEGGNNERELTDIYSGDWINFNTIDLTGMITIRVIASSTKNDVSLEVRQGSPSGTLLATIPISSTDGHEKYQEFSASLNQTITGETNLYFVAKTTNETGLLFNLDILRFSKQELLPITNVALAENGGVATQSSTAYGGVAERAIDGNTDGRFAGYSLSFTANGDEGVLKWWQVDLGEDKTINEIVIYNRSDGITGEILNNYTVEIENMNGDVTFRETYIEHPDPSKTIEVNQVVGKIVKISKTSDRELALAEVEVYGKKTLSIDKDEIPNNIQIYPNPATNLITIESASGSTLEIYNIHGAIISKSKILDSKKVINIESLSPGVYLLKFQNSHGVSIEKLIKK